jgi:hypothetical protein
VVNIQLKHETLQFLWPLRRVSYHCGWSVIIANCQLSLQIHVLNYHWGRSVIISFRTVSYHCGWSFIIADGLLSLPIISFHRYHCGRSVIIAYGQLSLRIASYLCEWWIHNHYQYMNILFLISNAQSTLQMVNYHCGWAIIITDAESLQTYVHLLFLMHN